MRARRASPVGYARAEAIADLPPPQPVPEGAPGGALFGLLGVASYLYRGPGRRVGMDDRPAFEGVPELIPSEPVARFYQVLVCLAKGEGARGAEQADLVGGLEVGDNNNLLLGEVRQRALVPEPVQFLQEHQGGVEVADTVPEPLPGVWGDVAAFFVGHAITRRGRR